jgi:hypothetical protein
MDKKDAIEHGFSLSSTSKTSMKASTTTNATLLE